MYTVKSGEQYAKITITDAETVKFSDKWDVFGVKGDDITVKLNSTDSGDGVYNTDDTGGAVVIAHGRRLDTMYLTGTGDVIVWAGASAVDCPFSKGGKGGGSSGDGTHYKGTTTTAITDGSTTNPITILIEDEPVTYTAVMGDIVVYGSSEFIFDSNSWKEIGRGVDTTPTSGSANFVTSDGVYKNTAGKKVTYGGETFNSYTGLNANTAYGLHSHAEGYATEASGRYSHASGSYTRATKDNMMAIGTFNSPRNNDLFNIGNGSIMNGRSNIVEVNSTSMNVNGDIKRDGVGIDDYTTAERKIGKWIDGSDLYQRTFEVTASSVDGWNDSILGTSGIKIVDAQGFMHGLYEGTYVSKPLVYYRGPTDFIALTYYSDVNVYIIDPGVSTSPMPTLTITIKYIKPSVQANLMQTAPTEEVSETPTVEEDDMR